MDPIDFPNNPLAYVSSPWVDDNGLSWLWAVRGPDIEGVPQGKWGRAPSAGITSPYTSSATPPEDKSKLWYDPEDGTLSAWNTDNLVWVQVSGSGGKAGVDAAACVVTNSTAPTGSTLEFLPLVDETLLLQSETASPVATITIILPSLENARIGQVKTFISSKPVSSLVGTIESGGYFLGDAPYSVGAFEAVAFQYVSPGAWVRLA